MNSATLYYFSGTGNSKKVAEWMAQTASDFEIDSELVNIGSLENRKIESVPESNFIGFISPTHGFNFPPIMFHFLLRFPRGRNNKVIIINTRAGMKMGKLFIPGLSGLAQYFSALILLIKGYKIQGMKSIDLPSNWISIHPGLKESVVNSIYEKRKKETLTFGRKIFQGKRSLTALNDLIQDLLITPVSLFYYIGGRFFFAKSFISGPSCSLCKRCIRECPVKAIKLVDNRPYWSWKCESCMKCMNNCPMRSIETAHGYLIIMILLIAMILWPRININKVHEVLSFLKLPDVYWEPLLFLLKNLIFFGSVFIVYRLQHLMMRFTFIHKWVSITTITHFNFWRRYKSPNKY